MSAPIAIFCYKRLSALKNTITSLKKCQDADQAKVYIFSDGPKNEKDLKKVLEVRQYLNELKGFKEIELFFSEKNRGLATSVITGVTDILKKHENIIVLEDDLVVSANFLVYMNKALAYYKNKLSVFTISAYNVPMDIEGIDYPYDVYFTRRASSWGWASWRDRWEEIDWQVKDFDKLKTDRQQIAQFNKCGSDSYNMLRRKMNGKIDSWAIAWTYHQFKKGTYSVFPLISKIKNIGFTPGATHSNVYNRYDTRLDDGLKLDFSFDDNVKTDHFYYPKFLAFYGIKARVIGRLKTYLYKLRLLSNK